MQNYPHYDGTEKCVGNVEENSSVFCLIWTLLPSARTQWQ